MDRRDRLIDGTILIVLFAFLFVFLVVAGQRDRLAYVLAAVVGVAMLPLSISYLRSPSAADEAGLARRDRWILATFIALWNGSLLILMARVETAGWWRSWIAFVAILVAVVIARILRGQEGVGNPLGRLVRRLWDRIEGRGRLR
jgi:hypothetical protein